MDDIGGFVSVRSHVNSLLKNIRIIFAADLFFLISALGVCGWLLAWTISGEVDNHPVWAAAAVVITGRTLIAMVCTCAIIHACRKRNEELLRRVVEILLSNMVVGVVASALVIVMAVEEGNATYILILLTVVVPVIFEVIGLVFVRYYFLLVGARYHGEEGDEESALLASTSECEQLLQGARREQWFIDFASVELQERIGAGAFGEVWRALWKKQVVAVKKMHEVVSPAALQEFMREAALLSKFRHPNVVQFFGASSSGDNLFLITEFASRGSLFDVIHDPKQKGSLSLGLRLRMALDAAKGVGYLHSLTPVVIHRDLKSPNLLVMEDWTVKVSDFGTSKWIEKTATMTANIGSPMWSAPEVLTQSQYSEKADIFSFAIVLWELLTLGELYPGKMGFQLAIEVGTQGLRPDIPPNLRERMASTVDLMERCWEDDPHARPAFPEIVATLSESVAMEGE